MLSAEARAAEDTLVHILWIHCMDCRSDFETPDPAPACPDCGSLEVAVEGGDEVVLEWLEYVDLPADRSESLVPAHTHLGGV